jgi:Glyoxalase-like domain
MSESSSTSSDSSCSGGGDDAKMQAMLSEWESGKDDDEADDVFVDSESEHSINDEDAARKMALLKADVGFENEEDESEESENEDKSDVDEDKEDDESEESVYEEEVVDEDEDEDEDDSNGDDGKSEKSIENIADDPASKEDNDDDDDGKDDESIEDTLQKKPKQKKVKTKLAPITAPTEGDTEEDAAMKSMLAEWGGNDDEETDDDSNDNEEDDSEQSEREVVLEDDVIDHIVLAAPDLEEALEQFQKMTGIEAKIFGSINGIGIRCARISFNDSTYLEIIAPDAKQPGPIGQLIKAKGIKELTPFHFAIRSSKTEQLKDEVGKYGYVPDHITMFGGSKDGTPKKWEMLYLYGHKLGGICPYFINWTNADHPCATLPVVGKLKKFTLRAPKDDPIHQLLEHVGVKEINIVEGTPKMSFQFSSPEGTIKFATGKAVGFKFPGFDEDEPCAGSDDEEVVFAEPETPELLDTGDAGEYEALPPPSY